MNLTMVNMDTLLKELDEHFKDDSARIVRNAIDRHTSKLGILAILSKLEPRLEQAWEEFTNFANNENVGDLGCTIQQTYLAGQHSVTNNLAMHILHNLTKEQISHLLGSRFQVQLAELKAEHEDEMKEAEEYSNLLKVKNRSDREYLDKKHEDAIAVERSHWVSKMEKQETNHNNEILALLDEIKSEVDCIGDIAVFVEEKIDEIRKRYL